MWAGEQGTERTISAPARSRYPATYMMSPVASAHLKGSCASCLAQGHCCLVWICLIRRTALWNCTRASCLAGICQPHQCMPWFRWRYGLMIWSSMAHPLPEPWLRSHCTVFPIRYAIPLVVHSSRTWETSILNLTFFNIVLNTDLRNPFL